MLMVVNHYLESLDSEVALYRALSEQLY